MSAPFVTVLIDSYNYGQYIEEAIDSALMQEFPRELREILVIDDGSTDDTPERLKKYGDSIRYLRKANGGQASAFNRGYSEARGEIIATLDADDLWLPDKLRRVCDTFQRNPEAGMVYHRTYLWHGAERLVADGYFAEISGRVPDSRVSLLSFPMVGTSCLAFRRSALEQLMPMPESLRSQADAYLTALVIFVAPVVALPEFLAKYRIHGANLFQAKRGEAVRSRVEHRIITRSVLLAEIRAWLERNEHALAPADKQAYLKQWTKAQEQDEFELHKPSRWRYFLHLLEYPRVYRDIKSTRHILYDYTRALAALILGYDHLHLLDRFRQGYKDMMVKLFEVAHGPGSAKEAVTKS